MIKIKFHSVVDVITNSSTVIYTYQNSVTEAKALVDELLKLSGVSDKTADDIFYYGVFCDDDIYFEDNDHLPDDCPKVNWNIDWKDDAAKAIRNKEVEVQQEWFQSFKLSIMKGEIEEPEWMSNRESDQYGDGWDPDSYLNLIPKNSKYEVFGKKIKALLGSIDSDGGRDG